MTGRLQVVTRPETDAILFDLDDTLVPDEAAFEEAALATAGSLDVPDRLGDAVRRHAREAWRAGPHWGWFRLIGTSSWEGLWAPAGGTGPRIEAIREWLSAVYRPGAWAAALADIGADPGLALQAAAEFAERREACCRAYPDAVPALERVRAAGLRTAVVTNGMSDLQWLKLDRAGLAPHFDVFVASSAVGIGKPDPRIFEVAIKRLGSAADAAWMVGDNPARDVAGARAAGIRSVWLDRRGTAPAEVTANATIGSLSDLRW
jgi:putative hydrolase of the HAD superfamily